MNPKTHFGAKGTVTVRTAMLASEHFVSAPPAVNTLCCGQCEQSLLILLSAFAQRVH